MKDQTKTKAQLLERVGLQVAGKAGTRRHPEGRKGRIRVELSRPNGAFALKVGDDGVGLPAGLDIDQVDSLGLRLVRILARQLQGEARITSNDSGTESVISFPAQT